MTPKPDTRTIQAQLATEIPQPPAGRDETYLYINRDLSWLEFNRRVLEEALQPELHPLLERVKFLAIFHSNLDEFFMIRVSGLKEQVAAGTVELPPDGMTPSEQLTAIRERLLPMVTQALGCWQKDLKPKLRKAGIRIRSYDDLSAAERTWLTEYFLREVFPVLTPLVFDPGHPFPQISNLSVNLAVKLLDPGEGDVHYGRIKVPSTLPRLVALPPAVGQARSNSGKKGPAAPANGGDPSSHPAEPTSQKDFVWMEQIVAANLAYLYPGAEIVEAYGFRVTRDADIEIQEDEADDLLRTIEAGIRQRRFGPVVRLEIDRSMPPHMRGLLMQNLAVAAQDVYEVDEPLGMSTLIALMDIDRYDLKDRAFVPHVPAVLSGKESIFAAIRRGDVLLHHPYELVYAGGGFYQARGR